MVVKQGGSFQRFNDPDGNPLISLNRDGTVFSQGVEFPDGTTQTTAASSGAATVALVADGVTDNLAAINAAISALPANGGTVQLVPQGTGACYVSGTLTITKNGVILRGNSPSPSTSATGALTLQFAAGIPGIVVNGASNVLIENLNVISRDTGAVTGDYGIQGKGSAGSITIRACTVRSFGDHGVMFDSTAGNLNHWRIDQSEAYANFGDGFHFTGGTDTSVGLALQLNATGNAGWGINLDTGASSNSFIEAHISSNGTGGIRVNTNSNFFHNVYTESSAVSSFVMTASANNNLVYFSHFGQPTTITNSGGSSNVFFYNQATIPGYANLSILPQTPGTGHVYKLTNGSFNANDLAISDDTGSTWLDFNFALQAILALKPLQAPGLIATAVAPTAAAGNLSIGSTTAASATAGSATLPANPLGFLIMNLAGVAIKVPYYAA